MKRFFLPILLLLVACYELQAQPITMPVETILPTPSTLFALSTARSSITFTPTLSRTQMANYQSMLATQPPFQTIVAQFPRLCPNDVPYFSEYGTQISPNGLWLGELCNSDNYSDLVLTFSNKETGIAWNLLYHDYIPDVNYADGGMWVVHWTSDSKYAFFNTTLGGDGAECYVSGLDSGSALFRIDVDTGETTGILPPNNGTWYTFSIAPTDRRLIFSVHHSGINLAYLSILDVFTNQVIDVKHKEDFSESGGYLWSPDGQQFLYSTVKYVPSGGDRENYTLRLVDAKTGKEEILLKSQYDCFKVRLWADDGVLEIEKNYKDSLIRFDLHSKTILSEFLIKP